MRRRIQTALLGLSVFVLVAFDAFSQVGSGPCATPRAAVKAVLKSGDLARGAACLDAEAFTSDEREELVRRVRSVFANRAIAVRLDDVPDLGGYVSPQTGEPRYVITEELPDVYIVRAEDGRWVWASGSLEGMSKEYSESLGTLASLVERLPPSFRGTLFGVQVWQYLSIVLLFITGLVIRKVIAFVVHNRVKSLADRLGQAWATRIVEVFASPGATLIMAGIVQVTYPELRLPLKAAFIMSLAVRVLAVLSIVWAMYRLVDVLAARMAKKAEETDSKLDDQLVPLTRKALKVLVVLAGGLFILQNLDVDVGSLLAGLGLGGLAFALAAKDTLANFFGSVMIFLDRPFQIGDWIRIGDVEGIVEEVGFRSTRIRTFYNSLVTVPNAKFTESKIDNMGVRQYRRCFVTLGITYDTTPEQMQAFTEGIRAIIQANPHTRKDYFEVHMSGFGAYALEVMVYFFFEVATWTEELTERHRVFLEIMRLARKLGVGFAFPTQTLHVDHLAQMGEPRAVVEPLVPAELAQVVDGFASGGKWSNPKGPRITHGYTAGSRAGGDAGEG